MFFAILFLSKVPLVFKRRCGLRLEEVFGQGRTASRRPLCTDLDPRSADAAVAGEGDAPVRQTAQLESGQNC